MNRQEKEALDRWIQREDTPLTADCQEAKEYCGKCPRSRCLWLMHEAFKPDEIEELEAKIPKGDLLKLQKEADLREYSDKEYLSLLEGYLNTNLPDNSPKTEFTDYLGNTVKPRKT